LIERARVGDLDGTPRNKVNWYNIALTDLRHIHDVSLCPIYTSADGAIQSLIFAGHVNIVLSVDNDFADQNVVVYDGKVDEDGRAVSLLPRPWPLRNKLQAQRIVTPVTAMCRETRFAICVLASKCDVYSYSGQSIAKSLSLLKAAGPRTNRPWNFREAWPLFMRRYHYDRVNEIAGLLTLLALFPPHYRFEGDDWRFKSATEQARYFLPNAFARLQELVGLDSVPAIRQAARHVGALRECGCRRLGLHEAPVSSFAAEPCSGCSVPICKGCVHGGRCLQCALAQPRVRRQQQQRKTTVG
jgi:hypothetical protein